MTPNKSTDIKQYAADVVHFARHYSMSSSGVLPLIETQESDQSAKNLVTRFTELSKIDGFLKKLNAEIGNAETKYKQNLAKRTINNLDESFNVSANPDLVDAITDYIIEATPDEVLEVGKHGEHEIAVWVNSTSKDIDIIKTSQMAAALRQDWKNAGIDTHITAPTNRVTELAAKALQAQVQLHLTI